MGVNQEGVGPGRTASRIPTREDCGVMPTRLLRITPIIPKEFFHTAGNFGEHHEGAQKAGFAHPVLPWIMFFQYVDAIIAQTNPLFISSILRRSLDYELELAAMLKKSGKHFSAIIPCTAKHPLGWPR